MSLRIRRGTEAQRSGITFDQGELIWTTDTRRLYVGDIGVQGGTDPFANIAGVGLHYNTQTKLLDANYSGLTTDTIPAGTGIDRQYFSVESAQDAAWALLRDGTHTNITFTYDDTLAKVNATVTLDGIGITAVQQDTLPRLGGNLSLNGKDITGTGNVNITGTITADSFVSGSLTMSGSGILSSFVPTPYPGYQVDHGTVFGSSTNPSTVFINSSNNFVVGTGITNGSATAGTISRTSRGTLAVPTAVQPNDALYLLTGMGHDGTNYVTSGAIGIFADPLASVTTGHVPGAFGAVVIDAAGNPITLTFTSNGVLSAPIFKATSYATGSLPTSPEEGWIVYDSTAKQFKGWNGTIWTLLG